MTSTQRQTLSKNINSAALRVGNYTPGARAPGPTPKNPASPAERNLQTPAAVTGSGKRRCREEEKPSASPPTLEPARSLESDARSRALPRNGTPEPRPLTEPALGRQRLPLGLRTAARGPGAGRAGVPRRSWPPRRPIGRRSKRARVVTGIKWVTRPSGSPAKAFSAPSPGIPRLPAAEMGRSSGRPQATLPRHAPQSRPCPAGNPSCPRGPLRKGGPPPQVPGKDTLERDAELGLQLPPSPPLAAAPRPHTHRPPLPPLPRALTLWLAAAPASSLPHPGLSLR
ncbi:uncharacterized protein LOC144581689 [Callithrix jacchus]